MLALREKTKRQGVWQVRIGCWALIALAAALPASAEPVRYLISVGNNYGFSDEPRLRHAARAADGFADVVAELGGIPPDKILVLKNKNIAAIEKAIADVAQRASKHDPDDVTVYFYYSGHGSNSSLHVIFEELRVAKLALLVAGMPVARGIVFVDACRTDELFPPPKEPDGLQRGAPDRPRTASASAAVAPSAQVVLIRSTAAGEGAQESDELGGGVFTFYLLNAMRGAGDEDGDGLVSLGEAYQYAYDRTLKRSIQRGIFQHGTATPELAPMRGIVLAEPGAGAARIVLPGGGEDVRYRLFRLPRGTMVAETWARPGRHVTMAVDSGRYVVQRQSESMTEVAEVNLPYGGEETVARDSFKRREAVSLTAMTRESATRNHEVDVGFGLSARGAVLGHGLQLRYGYRFENAILTAGLDLGLGHTDLSDSEAQVKERFAGGDFRLDWRFELEPIELRLGAGLQALWIETGEGDDADVSMGVGPIVAANLHVPIVDRWAWRLSVAGTGLFVQQARNHVFRTNVLMTTGPSIEF